MENESIKKISFTIGEMLMGALFVDTYRGLNERDKKSFLKKIWEEIQPVRETLWKELIEIRKKDEKEKKGKTEVKDEDEGEDEDEDEDEVEDEDECEGEDEDEGEE